MRVEDYRAVLILGGRAAVRDGHIVTAQTRQSHPEFYREAFAYLGGGREASRS